MVLEGEADIAEEEVEDEDVNTNTEDEKRVVDDTLSSPNADTRVTASMLSPVQHSSESLQNHLAEEFAPSHGVI